MKSITKPSFLKMLLVRSVALVLIFLCASYTWISYYAEKQREKKFNRLLNRLEYLAVSMQSLSENGTTETEEARNLILDIQQELDYIWITDGIYISAYLFSDKIAETRDRAYITTVDYFPLLVKNIDTTYELKDISVLPPELLNDLNIDHYYDNDPVKKLLGTKKFYSIYGFREFYADNAHNAIPGMLQISEQNQNDTFDRYAFFSTEPPQYSESSIMIVEESEKITIHVKGAREISEISDHSEYKDYLDLTPEDTSGYTLIQKYNELSIITCSAKNTPTEDDVNYCYGYGNTSQVFDKTTRLYKLDKNAEYPDDIYGSYSYDFNEATYPPITVTPFFPELDWSLKIAFDDDPSAFEMMPYTCITIYSLAVIIGFLAALVWAYFAYRRERHIWDVLEFRRGAIEAIALDLKSPVEEISSNLKTLHEGFTLDPTPHYNAIEQNTDKMNRKIEDVLDYTHSESGSVTVEPEFVDLDSLVKQSIKDLDMHFKVASLKTEFKGSSMTVETDPKLFKQALDNLLSNCAHHADPNSTITINLTTTKLTVSNKTSLEIKNANDLKKPFVKGENEAGTGLGLSIVENNLRLLGYSLDLSLKDGIFTAKIKF
ncbi:MAG: HAMP domain-containing histidine kinase [Clostridia bacterium]|nr:HAMP domain-containing histidine kinase [Clostridia bacterium]